jgi:hypothetical protein
MAVLNMESASPRERVVSSRFDPNRFLHQRCSKGGNVSRVGHTDEWHVVIRKLLADFKMRPFLRIRSRRLPE